MLLDTLEKLLNELKEENLRPTKKKVTKLMEIRDMDDYDRKMLKEYLEMFHEREDVFIPVSKFKNWGEVEKWA